MGPYRQIDAEAVQKFANQLRGFEEATTQQLQALVAHLAAMNSNGEWQDENYDKYHEEFQDVVRMIQLALAKFRDEQQQELHRLANEAADLRYR